MFGIASANTSASSATARRSHNRRRAPIRRFRVKVTHLVETSGYVEVHVDVSNHASEADLVIAVADRAKELVARAEDGVDVVEDDGGNAIDLGDCERDEFDVKGEPEELGG